MAHKGIPDWLNSSIWSSNPTSYSGDRFRVPSPKASTETLKPEAPIRAPVPEAPPTRRSPQRPPRPQPAETQKPEAAPPAGDPSPSSRFSPEEVSRQSQLLDELSKKVINIEEVRRLASQGIPDGAGIRSMVWKLLLCYLPNDHGLWAQELEKKRSQYEAFKDEFLVNPSEVTRRLEESAGPKYEESEGGNSGLLSRSEITHGEHPLSLGRTSVWNQFFQDTEIIEQIDRDVRRTHPDMHFFSGDSSFAKSNQEALRRILIIFAKLNPGIRYVQGMNEVLAPLLYVFRNDPDENNAVCAEADAFFCFVELLSEFRDNFCQKLDNSVVGIRATITKLSELLKKHDGELWRHLEITTKLLPAMNSTQGTSQRFMIFDGFKGSNCKLNAEKIIVKP
ncbi:TBC domain-containing protein C1952.17c-like isoform X2 [Phoenix dactylifera]|uniref:TBC domain-containing protein C1952.17c-like isoform X2 n=1 Tax=Phoenix dactylifera TaxID=42345 RepID=A0A8B7MUQ6_PHODC|nr:TBC domain-containing protein C1952.17c-like isoform X2 [Phoenix dactylifera]